MVMDNYLVIRDTVNYYGEIFLSYMNPDLPARLRQKVTAGLPFMDLDIALLFTFGYLLLVSGGFLLSGKETKEKQWSSGVAYKKGDVVARKGYGIAIALSASSDVDPKVSSKTGFWRKRTLSEKLSGEPVLYLQAFYNAVQVGLCGYMMVTAAAAALNRGFRPLCNAFESEPPTKDLINVLHIFYLSKILDYLDTVFMIVRGKWTQFSFLHIYHHTSIFLVYWMVANVAYDGDVYYTIVANSFIHLVMYSYYLATTLDISAVSRINERFSLVTNLQLLQFVTMMLQGVVLLVGKCAYPKNVTLFYVAYIFSLFLLFQDFKGKRYGAAGALKASPSSSGASSPALPSPSGKGVSSSLKASDTTATMRPRRD